MSERPPTNIEAGAESIPTSLEVQRLFEQFVGDSEYESVRQLEDEDGLYLWDIVVHNEDGDVEYSYMRAGRYPEGQASATAIHVTFVDAEGIPVGGHSVAKLIGGSWVETP